MSDEAARPPGSTTGDGPRPPREAIPGPSGTDLIPVVSQSLRNDITAGLAYLRREYGPTAWLNLPGSFVRGIVLSRPQHVEQVLATDQHNYRKPDEYLDLLRYQRNGLTTSRGAEWRAQNQVLSPLFQRDSVYGFTDVVIERTERLSDRWQGVADRGGMIVLQEEMGRLSFSILGRTMVSSDMDEYADEIREAHDAIRTFMRRKQSPVPYPSWLLTRQSRDAVDRLRQIARELIGKRRGRESEYEDLLTMMMTADTEGSVMDDERIVDNIITFLVGGHETTAIALTWTWYLLAQHPSIHRRVHDTATDASVRTNRSVTPEALQNLRFIKQAVQEGMRIYPPVPLFAREAIDDGSIGGYQVPSGTVVMISPFLTHRDPGIWDDPTAYRPERFHHDRAGDRPRYSFFPFGGGDRMCIGRQFALMEARLILGLLSAEFRLELESPIPGDIGVRSASTMVPDTELKMSVQEWE